jgi:hypothetical protein
MSIITITIMTMTMTMTIIMITTIIRINWLMKSGKTPTSAHMPRTSTAALRGRLSPQGKSPCSG